MIKIKLLPRHVDYISNLIKNEVARLELGDQYLSDSFDRFLAVERDSIRVAADMSAIALALSKHGELECFDMSAPFSVFSYPDEHSYMVSLAIFIQGKPGLHEEKPDLYDLVPQKPIGSTICLKCNGTGYPVVYGYPEYHIKYPNLICGTCEGSGYLPPAKRSEAEGAKNSRKKKWKPGIPWKITLSDYGLSAPDDDPTPQP
jgi:hypothetical protein